MQRPPKRPYAGGVGVSLRSVIVIRGRMRDSKEQDVKAVPPSTPTTAPPPP